MNLARVAKENLFKNIKQYYFCISTYALAIIVIFNIINSTYTPGLLNLEGMSREVYFSVMTMMFLLVCIGFVMGCFVSHYFATTKVKELGVVGISGGSITQTVIYIGIQNIILQLIGIVLGLILAILISPLYTFLINVNLGGGAPVFYISGEAIGVTIAIIVIETVMSILVDTGFAYRKSILELMNYDKTTFEKDRRLFKKHTLVYWITFILGILPLYYLAGEDVGPVFWLDMGICVLGAMGILKFWVPKFLNKKRVAGKIYDSEKMIWTGNMVALIVKISTLLGFIMVVVVSAIGPLLCTSSISYSTIFITNLQVGSIMILLGLAVMFKVMMEVNMRKKIYTNIKLMGYTSEQIKRIIKKEIGSFFGIFTILTYMPILIMAVSSVSKNMATIAGVIQISMLPLIMLILLTICTYYIYKNEILRNFKR